MSHIQKILAAECLDPCADVHFAAILNCKSKVDVSRCQARLSPFAGEIHVENHGTGYLFLLMAGLAKGAERVLPALVTLLDEEQQGITLVETKYVNGSGGPLVEHSFRFASEGTADETTILLAPSQAFGSGDHPSTGLAITFLEQLAPLSTHVLDVGCGTGVLSFVATKLGATSVLGVDIDEEGLHGATQNAKFNELEARTHFENKPLAEITETFPLILANLTCSVLQYLLNDLTALATPDGKLIVSGLQGRQGDEAEAFLADCGWRVVQGRSAGKWQALLAEKVDLVR